MKIKIKKLHQNAVIPKYAKPGDAGLDLTCVKHQINPQFNYIQYHTGLAIEIPKGYVGLLFPRSSVSDKDLSLANCVGVIDSGYRGEICFRYRFPGASYYAKLRRYTDGERVGQLIILPFPEIEFEETDSLSETERSDGGYGSTGN